MAAPARAAGAGDPGCVFCRVIEGTAPGTVVWADEHTVTILDLRQPTYPDGAHLLILLRAHVETIDRLGPQQAAALMQATVAASALVRRTFDPQGVSVWQSNGTAAGQEVPHVHVHVLTRSAGDGLLRIYPSRPATPDSDALEAVAARLRTVWNGCSNSGSQSQSVATDSPNV